jgi:BON domain
MIERGNRGRDMREHRVRAVEGAAGGPSRRATSAWTGTSRASRCHSHRAGSFPAEVETALKRDAQIDAQGINIKADGGKVTLSGRVRSFAERDGADWAAWSAPGVTEVKNDLGVV